jgi:hypothetical protein
MYTNVVVHTRANRRIDIGSGSVGLLAYHGDASVVNRIVQDDSDDAGVLFRGGAKRLETGGGVEKEVLYLLVGQEG